MWTREDENTEDGEGRRVDTDTKRVENEGNEGERENEEREDGGEKGNTEKKRKQ